MDAETPNQIIGVLAHETGHIAGGHLSKLRAELANCADRGHPRHAARRRRRGGSGAHASGSVGGNPMAAIVGPQSAIMRSLLAYAAPAGRAGRPRRRQFPHPDRASPPRACTTPSSDSPTSSCSRRNVPIPISSRIRCRPSASPRWPRSREPAPIGTRRTRRSCRLRHDLIRAKLFGYHGPARHPAAPLSAERHQPCRRAMPARCRPIAMPICASRSARSTRLIQAQPNNPYFYELKGQALVESGRGQEAHRAAAPRDLARARPDPDPRPARPGAGRDQRHPPARRGDIEPAHRRAERPGHPRRLRPARHGLWPQEGDLADADLASAQAAFNRGNLPTARQLASRAKGRFPIGSPGWVKADDIASYQAAAATPACYS